MSTKSSRLDENYNAWPFVEARALFRYLDGEVPKKGYVLFETGYGPSGLPHIGTFGEVARTSMVRNAFEKLFGFPTKLFAFSDDMDGLRKVPDNIPNKKMIKQHLGMPLTRIPDPFETHESFGHHNNARLCTFLDDFGFEYDFKSSTEFYTSGKFDKMLLKVLSEYDRINNLVLPTLGSERRETYSPFLPICSNTGLVLQVPVIERNVDAGTIVYKKEDGVKVETPVTGGHCKLQWKADWGMRWAGLGVDYEMSGKDLIDSVKLSKKICTYLGCNPPLNLTYELFLDEKGAKISKSKGNGLSVEEWLRYAPPESLSLFMYNKPKTAKRLYFDVIPRNVDEYQTHIANYGRQDEVDRMNSPVWHIHAGSPPSEIAPLSYNVLLNLASVCHTEEKEVLWYFISRYRPEATPHNAPTLDKLLEFAINYYRDFIRPAKKYRSPNDKEKVALNDLKQTLQGLPPKSDATEIQKKIYEVGKRHEFNKLKDWFKALYEILLGQSEGPRMGSFIALYGIEESIELISQAVGEDQKNS